MMSKIEEIIRLWKEGKKQVEIANEFDVTEAYVSQILAPEKKRKAPIPTEQKTTIIHRPSKVSIPIDNVNWVLILKILDRGYSTIKNKPEVKAKKGGYYFDSLTWEAEIDKIKEIAKVMKLMGDEK